MTGADAARDTLDAIVLAMSETHSGDAAEAYAIAWAILAAIRKGEIPGVVKLERKP